MRLCMSAIQVVLHVFRSGLLMAALACTAAGYCTGQSSVQSPAVVSKLVATQEHAHAASGNAPKPATVPVPDPVGTDPHQAIAEECAELFRLAVDLRSAVNKTTKDMLSVTVVRKADSLEQLARKVKGQIQPWVKR